MAIMPAPEPDVGTGAIWKVQDIARFLRVSREQVRRLISFYGLPAFDLGTGEKQHEWRAYPEEVIAWTKQSRMPAGGAARADDIQGALVTSSQPAGARGRHAAH